MKEAHHRLLNLKAQLAGDRKPPIDAVDPTAQAFRVLATDPVKQKLEGAVGLCAEGNFRPQQKQFSFTNFRLVDGDAAVEDTAGPTPNRCAMVPCPKTTPPARSLSPPHRETACRRDRYRRTRPPCR